MQPSHLVLHKAIVCKIFDVTNGEQLKVLFTDKSTLSKSSIYMKLK